MLPVSFTSYDDPNGRGQKICKVGVETPSLGMLKSLTRKTNSNL